MRVLALAAHPDDIEFMMTGTLLRLKEQGCELHYWNLANGSCGYKGMAPQEVARMREAEARTAASRLGAVFYPSFHNDLEIFYEQSAIRKVSAVMRKIAPDILLIPSLVDYMEDHVNTARIGVTSAFARCMDNWRTEPESKPIDNECVVYHAMPYGLRDSLERQVRAGGYVDVAPVMEEKRALLACHRSQKEWLDQSQGMDSYIKHMDNLCAAMGKLSGVFSHAEGWTRHNPAGFSSPDNDPLKQLLGKAWVGDEEHQRLTGKM